MSNRQKIRKGLLVFSFLLFPITIYYFSPVLIVMGASQGIIVGSFIVFASMFLCSLFFGRAFCGWLCAAGGLEEIAFSVNDKPVRKFRWIKYLTWSLWIISIIVLFVRSGGIKSIEPFYKIPYGISLSVIYSFIIYYFLVLLIFLLSILIGKRSFCNHICWMAPFMVIGRKIRNVFNWPSLQLKVDNDECTHCHNCSRKCPMSLDVEEMVIEKTLEHSECIYAGGCIDICRKNVIKFGFKKRIRKEKHQK